MLIYFAGSAGSSEIVNISRVLVYNSESRTFYGDYTYCIRVPGGEDYPCTKFTFEDHGFVVEDKTIGLKKRIPY